MKSGRRPRKPTKSPRLPVIGPNESHYPKRALCPWCRKRKVLEPHSFAVLSGGALSGIEGFLNLTWHGAHDGGEGRKRDVYVNVAVVRDSEHGQFSLYFCSTVCLRRFFAACVDRLDEKVKEQVAEFAEYRRKKASGQRVREPRLPASLRARFRDP